MHLLVSAVSSLKNHIIMSGWLCVWNQNRECELKDATVHACCTHLHNWMYLVLCSSSPSSGYLLLWAVLRWAPFASYPCLSSISEQPIQKDTLFLSICLFLPLGCSGLFSVHLSKVTLKIPILICC